MDTEINHTSVEELAVKTFLSRYPDNTRETYTYALKKFFAWCSTNDIKPFDVKRPILELFIRWMESEGTSRSTISHQFGVIRGFYKYAVIDEFIDKSPADHVKTPRAWDDDSLIIGLDRFELGSLIRASKDNSTEHALVLIMSMLGLRVSEACSINIEDFQYVEQGHNVVKFVGKGGKPATIPLPVAVFQAMSGATGGRSSGPLFLRQTGQRKGTPHDRMSVRALLTRLSKKADLGKNVHPHMLRHSFVSAALLAGVSLRLVQLAARHSDPRTTARYDGVIRNHQEHATHAVSSFLAGVS